MTQRRVTDDLDQLLEVLPPAVRNAVEKLEGLDSLIEIVLDLGRQPEARLPDRFVYLSETQITRQELEYVIKRVGAFGSDNRAGIERTLHRISGIRNRQGEIIGLTCRVGRAVYGTIDIVRDVIETGKSVLFLGRPGVGKTTMLREVARVLSDGGKRVIVVDTSNEIAGDGDIPHPAIGHARRMQVSRAERQAEVMIEAVENHMPEVIIIDEIGTQQEAEAARTIAERGVQLIGTAHGNTLENLVLNPTLSDLIGGIHAVTLGDEEARKRGTQKTVLERKAPPTFDIVVEIQEKDRFAIHPDVASTIDALLRGFAPSPEIRQRSADGEVQVIQPAKSPEESWGGVETWNGLTNDQYADNLPRERRRKWERVRGELVGRGAERGPVNSQPVNYQIREIKTVYPYAVSRNRLERVIAEMKAPVHIAQDLETADMILTLKGQYRKMPKKLKEAEHRNVPIYVIRSNTMAQMEGFLREFLGPGGAGDPLKEAEEAIRQVRDTETPIELAPQNAYVRRLQHQLAEKYQLRSKSVGEEPHRRVTIFPS